MLYWIGCILAFIASLAVIALLNRKFFGELRLSAADVIMAVILSFFSWLVPVGAVIIVLVVALVIYLDNIYIWRKK